jgi:hypothetical protein
MNYKQIFFITGIALLLGCSSKNKQQAIEGDKEKMLYPRNVKEYLGHPFGTVVKLEAELVDGTTRNIKGDEDILFLRVTSVAGIPLKNTVEIRFEDETGKVSPYAFGLYRTSRIDAEIKDVDTASEIKKGFIGRKIKLAA